MTEAGERLIAGAKKAREDLAASGAEMTGQPDFGHQAFRGAGFHLDVWGGGPMLIRYRGKSWRFEFSEMFGPALLTKSGEIAVVQPVSERHPFWKPFHLWNRTGRKRRAVRTKRGKLRFYLCHMPRGDWDICQVCDSLAKGMNRGVCKWCRDADARARHRTKAPAKPG